MRRLQRKERLKKELRLADVFAISTGAIFSSGFFLLPGIAAAKAGPAVVLAYLLAGVLIIPAMYSAAELSTAMPRAGGTYYFIDRSLGSGAGIIGGIGSWLSLVFKSAFALLGMGAYATIYFEIDIKIVATILTIFFCLLNIFGAKETSGIQKFLVTILLMVLGFFIIQGSVYLSAGNVPNFLENRFGNFLPFGTDALVSTIGLVFVSYIGLTKVTSVSEEVSKPDRNIPNGMILSWIVATFVHVAGVFIVVSIMEPSNLWHDLTPIATTAISFFSWLPNQLGVVLIVIAAVAAFASTANAGILAASRYLLAMSRDRIIWKNFAQLGKFKTPHYSILVTSLVMILIILFLGIESVAKLAGTIQLLLFALLNFSVIVMRESKIESYVPGYYSPLYPWLQILGIICYLGLILMMGIFSIIFTITILLLILLWYIKFVRKDVVRSGAIYHVFERLGRRRFAGLETELSEILKEKGLKEKDPYDSAITRAGCFDFSEPINLSEIINGGVEYLANKIQIPNDELQKLIMESVEMGLTPVEHGTAIFHARVKGLQRSEMAIARAKSGLNWDVPGKPETNEELNALFFLIGGNDNPGLHLRLLGTLAERIEDDNFLPLWMRAENHHELKSSLLRLEKVLILKIKEGLKTEAFIGKKLMEINFHGCLVALLKRHDDNIVPHGKTIVRADDILTLIGEPDNLKVVSKMYQEKRGTKA